MKKSGFFKGVICALAVAAVAALDAGGVELCVGPNEPVGTPRGIYPGRVAWAHAPGAAKWSGEGRWFAPEYNDRQACDSMVNEVVLALSGASSVRDGWGRIFAHFNAGRGVSRGYLPGEKIAVKINNNNTSSHDDSDEINASPQMVLALLRSMVNDGGIRQEDITVAEPSRYVTDFMFDLYHGEFPGVRFVDNSGGDGRVKAEYTDSVMHYSCDNGRLATGIENSFVSADYVINMALLKGHVGQGVTLCGKNWYGAMNIHPDWRKNYHNNFDQSRDGKYKYMTFVDFMGHPYLGGKCVLWLIDGMYGCRNVGGSPESGGWRMSPFDGAAPASLLGSLDPVAVDAVGMDILLTEFPTMPDVDYADMYLMEAAAAPSGTRYDPNGDGKATGSLGVVEHWNNPRERAYSRNLGTGDGIELVYRLIK